MIRARKIKIEETTTIRFTDLFLFFLKYITHNAIPAKGSENKTLEISILIDLALSYLSRQVGVDNFCSM